MVATKPITAPELLTIPDDPRVELIDGRLVERSPRYARAALMISDIVRHLLLLEAATHEIFPTFAPAGYLVASDPDSVLTPSVGILTRAQFERIDWQSDGYIPVAPAIAIEVTQETDREEVLARKVAIYLAAGTQEVWLIRSGQREVHVHAFDDAVRVLDRDRTLAHPTVLPGFALPVAELFAE